MARGRDGTLPASQIVYASRVPPMPGQRPEARDQVMEIRSVGMSVCRSVVLSVCQSVGLSVCRSVGRWVCLSGSILGAQRVSVGLHFGSSGHLWGSILDIWGCLGLHLGVSWAPFWGLWDLLRRLGGPLGITRPPMVTQRQILASFWSHFGFILEVKIHLKSELILD